MAKIPLSLAEFCAYAGVLFAVLAFSFFLSYIEGERKNDRQVGIAFGVLSMGYSLLSLAAEFQWLG